MPQNLATLVAVIGCPGALGAVFLFSSVYF
jgi:hypothetical protein